MRIAACVKWVDLRPEPDGVLVRTHPRTSGASLADHAALELALQAAEAAGGDVVAVTAGPAQADAVLREALAVGAAQARRVRVEAELSSADVAAALAEALRDCDQIWCGDQSLDRGSGSVPAFLAAELGLPQALGLVETAVAADGTVSGLRRLDGGRRERLRVDGGHAVLSVEGAAARVRRASLSASMASAQAEINAIDGPPYPAGVPPVFHPYRPRSRVLAGPRGDTALERVAALTATGAGTGHGEVVTLPPAEAAERILAALAEWGEHRTHA
jgi:electron transfer flavoprotein beta subunit